MHIVEFLKEINKKLDAGVLVSINGNNATIKSAPVTGAKAITTIAAFVFAF